MAKTILRSALELFTMPHDEDNYPLVKHFRYGEIQTYQVLVDDFDRIEDEAQGIGTAIGFATSCISAAFTITITLATVTVADSYTKITLRLTMLLLYIIGLFFSVQAFRQRGRLRKLMRKIKSRQIPPSLGEKGSEIGPAESAQLPSETADSSTIGGEEKL